MMLHQHNNNYVLQLLRTRNQTSYSHRKKGTKRKNFVRCWVEEASKLSSLAGERPRDETVSLNDNEKRRWKDEKSSIVTT